MKEVQHAEVTIQVAIPVETDSEDEWRERFIRDHTETAVKNGEDIESRRVTETELTRIETMEEAAHRHEAEAEIRYEKKIDRQRERRFDRRGHF